MQNVYNKLSCHGRTINKLQFGTLPDETWRKTASAENAINGFRACSLYPVNRQEYAEYAYAPLNFRTYTGVMALGEWVPLTANCLVQQ